MPPILNGVPEPVTLPNWGDFKLGMHTNAAYQRVAAQSANRLTVNRLESMFTSQIENWPIAAQLWAHMLQGCNTTDLPTEDEAATWNQLAQATNMPITFNSQGFMTPNDN